jgi:Protein of unknown function (DUF2911)
MKKLLLIVGVVVAVGLLGVSTYMRNKEKSLSPETKAVYKEDGLELVVFYSSPSKKGREIFGGLVPYGELWRTGANEPTVFATNKDVLINGQKVKEGRYQLITIPYPDRWTIILNSDIPGWGISQETGKVYRNTKTDVLVFDSPAIKQTSSAEQFNISLDKKTENVELTFLWDSTKVIVPITRKMTIN